MAWIQKGQRGPISPHGPPHAAEFLLLERHALLGSLQKKKRLLLEEGVGNRISVYGRGFMQDIQTPGQGSSILGLPQGRVPFLNCIRSQDGLLLA